LSDPRKSGMMNHYRKNPFFVARKMEGQGFLIPVSEDIRKMCRVYKVNDIGWFVWQNLERHGDPKTLASLISKRYGVAHATAFQDLMTFLEELRRVGALVKEKKG
jgi:hypothetical protein